MYPQNCEGPDVTNDPGGMKHPGDQDYDRQTGQHERDRPAGIATGNARPRHFRLPRRNH